MKRVLALIFILSLVFVSANSAFAKQPAVKVRIEAANYTIWSATVSVGSSSVTDMDGAVHNMSLPTVLGALDNAADLGAFSLEVKNYQNFGLFVNSIAGEGPVTGSYDGWMYRVNYHTSLSSANECRVKNGDEVLWYFGGFNYDPLVLTLNKKVLNRGQKLVITVKSVDGNGKMKVVSGARVHIGQKVLKTGSDGVARLTQKSLGTFGVYAEKAGTIRSQKYRIRIVK